MQHPSGAGGVDAAAGTGSAAIASGVSRIIGHVVDSGIFGPALRVAGSAPARQSTGSIPRCSNR
jgi:hypothetical protein